MSPANLSPDARAVVRAFDGLTTQVRRIADALSTPVVEDAEASDDDATTPATTCSALYAGTDPMRWCIRAAHHTGKDHVDETGYHWSDTVAVYPIADGVVKRWAPGPVTSDFTSPLTGIEVRVPCPYCPPPAMIPRTLITDHIAREHGPGLVYPPNLATSEDTRRIARRRDSVLNLLDRLDRNGTLTDEERALLRRSVQDEGIERDNLASSFLELTRHMRQVSAGRATWKAKAEEIERDRDQQAAVLSEVLRRFAPALVQGKYAFYQAEQPVPIEEFERWRSVVHHDVERPWWQQLDEARAELEQAQAAVERVREVKAWLRRSFPALTHVRGRLSDALDGTEQPTTEEQPRTCTATIPDALGSPALHRCVAPVGHYDESRDPVCTGPEEDRDPGGWHTDGEGHVWSDRAANATPHGQQPTTEA